MKFEVQRVEYPTPKVKFLVEVDLAEVAGMAKTALYARQTYDQRWEMFQLVLTHMFGITEVELVEKLEAFAGKGV